MRFSIPIFLHIIRVLPSAIEPDFGTTLFVIACSLHFQTYQTLVGHLVTYGRATIEGIQRILEVYPNHFFIRFVCV